MRMFDVSEHDSDITCVHSCLNTQVFPDVLPKVGFNIIKSLQSVYPLLNIIFTKLSYDDLMSCKLVNKCWKDIASSELRKRNQISWAVLERLGDRTTAPATLKTSQNYQQSTCTTAIYVYNNKMLQMNKFVCNHSPKSVKRMTFKEYIQDDLSSKHLKNYCFLSGRNISSPYFTRTKNPGESRNMVAAIFLPDIPGIRLKIFMCSPKNIQADIQCEMRKTELFRCVIPFTFNHRITATAIAKLLSYCTANTLNGKKLAMGGGLLDSVSLNTKVGVFRKSDVCFISFLQDTTAENCTFEAYSVVLVECEEARFRASLEKFQKQVECKGQSILFKFNCCDKENKDVEDEIIKDYFRNSVLIGMDVNGEIGINNINVDPEYDLGTSFYHGYTTVLVLITW